MRRFTDAAGRSWDVVAGRESWGAFYALFVPRTAPGAQEPSERALGALQAPLRARDYAAAEREIDALSDRGLQELLERSSPKSTG